MASKEFDAVARLIAQDCGDTIETATGTLKTVFNFSRLIELARLNGIDVTKYQDQNDPLIRGRIRMSIGNALRGRLRKSGELLNIRGEVALTYSAQTEEAA